MNTNAETKVLRDPNQQADEDVRGDAIIQADAMATMICGEGFQAFNTLADDIQANYLWALSEMISRARAAHERIARRSMATRTSER